MAKWPRQDPRGEVWARRGLHWDAATPMDGPGRVVERMSATGMNPCTPTPEFCQRLSVLVSMLQFIALLDIVGLSSLFVSHHGVQASATYSRWL
jgi:hypothetical protein